MSDLAKYNFFLKVDNGPVMLFQLYAISTFSSRGHLCFGSSQLKCILRSLQGPIALRIQESKSLTKKAAKHVKPEIHLIKENDMTVSYSFRKNACRDFLLMQDIGKECLSPEQPGQVETFSAFPVFQDRIIVTVHCNGNDNEALIHTEDVESYCIAGTSEYFSGSSIKGTFSAQRKKAALSKINSMLVDKEKIRSKQDEANVDGVQISHTDSVMLHSSKQMVPPNIVDVCRKFEYKNRALVNVTQNVTSSESTPVLQLGCKTSVGGSEENCTISSDIVLQKEEFKNDCFPELNYYVTTNGKCSAKTRSLKRRWEQPAALSSTSSYLISEDNVETGNLKVSKVTGSRVLRTTRPAFQEGSCKKKAIEKKTSNSKEHASFSVEHYGDVCIDNISCVTQLDATQVCYLVRSMEREIRDIFEGKSFSKRHQDYKSGGKTRADLAFKVHFGKFSEDQQDAITDSLRQMFCYKHTKYFDYVLKVLVPETMIFIMAKINKGIDHAQAEKMLADG